MAFFLGIDGGGSKTECVLADEAGTVLARATGAGSNLGRVSDEELRSTVKHCLEELRRATGLEAIALDGVGAGFAGISQPEGRARAQAVVRDVLRPRRLYLVGDMEVALEAAVGAGAGVVLLSGTGSIAYGRNTSGRQARAGGRGPEASDEGSGFDIGRAAVEAVRQAEAGSGPATVLSEALPPALGLEAPEELEGWTSPGRATELAALVPLVTRAARRGDAVAGEILQQAGRRLAALAMTVLEQLELLAAEVRVATSGGVFRESPEVFSRVEAELRAAAPRARVEPLEVSPAEGAVRLAQRLWLEEQAGART